MVTNRFPQKKPLPPGIYRFPEPIKPPKMRIPKGNIRSPRRDRNKSKREKNKKSVVRGKEVSVVEPSSEAQIIYGTMRVGGVITFRETNNDSKAYVVTGTSGDENELIWTWKTAGTAGNNMTLTIVRPSGTTPSTTFAQVGNNIICTVRVTGGTSVATMTSVIARIEDFPAIAALISVRRVDSSKNGVVKASAETSLQYGGGKWLHSIVTLCCHQLQSVNTLYINNIAVTFGATPDARWGTGRWANKVFMDWEYGTDDQLANADLIGQLPSSWGENRRQRGHAYAYIITVWDKNLFAEGDPEFSFDVFGKPCYDPRTATTVFTRNSALIAADILMNERFGFKIPQAKIDMDALTTAANICDEDVAIAEGGTENRYSCDGLADTSMSPDDILSQVLETMDGDVVYEAGMYKIFAAGWRAPVKSFDEDSLRGTVLVKTKRSRTDSFNTVRGTYVSLKADYNETDFPLVTNSTYVTEDGEERCLDLALNFVTSASQAQRLAKIALERLRQAITVNYPGTMALAELSYNDVIELSLAQFGFVAKTFEVDKVNFVEEQDGYLGMDIDLREIAEGVFDWDSGEETEVDLAPDSTLPDATDVAEPTALLLESGTDQLFERNDGTIWTRLKVSWTESVTQFVISGGGYRIQYRPAAGSWSQAIDIPGGQNFHFITDVNDGASYEVRILAYNSLGYQSDWVTDTHTVIGKTAPPSNVTVLNLAVSDFGIKANWPGVTDVDLAKYEIRSGTVWETGTVVARIQASDGNVGNLEILYAGTHNLMIKAIDTTGNYSVNAALASVTINGPQPVSNFTAGSVGNNVLLNWDTPSVSTLTVNKYLVYKGDYGTAFVDADLLGVAFGTFHTYVERFGGTFSYWVVAEDVGGNISTERMSFTTVVPSSDFFIQNDSLLYPDLSTKYYAIEVDSQEAVYAPTNSEATGFASLPLLLNSTYVKETWEEHFVDNSQTSMQDFITAGYTYYLEPTPTGVVAYFEFHKDYGVVFPTTFIDFRYNMELLDGAVTVTPYLKISEDDLSYVTYDDTQQLFATDTRYVTYGIKVEATDDTSLAKFDGFRAVLQVQRAEESQVITANAGDVGGTIVTFQNTFLDVEDIQVSVNSLNDSRVIYSYDYSVTPAEQTCAVFVFDVNGDRSTEEVSVRIRGVVSS